VEDDANAAALRNGMAEWLLRNHVIRAPQVEEAMRSVPRHLFIPQASVEAAYEHRAVVTRRDEAGIAISSASEPGIVAQMLGQLDVQQGHHVLEIGAGTGYNAALLAHLAGPNGQVTTIDLDEDIVTDARTHLAAAGYGSVTVIQGDGAAGCPGNAPYDRIIVTAGAWDLPPAWREQLTAAGRLVVPLRMRGFTRSIAFERDGNVLRGQGMSECGFMPMRGPAAITERNLVISAGQDPVVVLRIDDEKPADESALSGALRERPVVAWTGIVVPPGDLEHMDFWLADLDGYCRVLLLGPARALGLPEPVYDYGSMGAYTGGTFAYLTRRDAGQEGAGGVLMQEIGVCTCGPAGGSLASQVTARLDAWNRAKPSIGTLRIDAYPAGTAADPGAFLAIRKLYTELHAYAGAA
jgi:protein-L-isoaspartate(D-aspartate) O-methyltransferase